MNQIEHQPRRQRPTMSSTMLFVELVSTASSALAIAAAPMPNSRPRPRRRLVVIEPEAQDHGADQPQRDEPEEEVREASGQQAAAVPQLAREGIEADVGARDALTRLLAGSAAPDWPRRSAP